ncbi:LORF2 protein, partial [Crocuta crocuta]
KIQNTVNTKYRQACGAPGALIHCWWECKMALLPGETCRHSLRKPTVLLLCPSSTHAPWYLRKRVENLRSHKTCTWIFAAALSIITKTWKQPRCPSVGKWINNLYYIQTMEYYS